jgi:hypothetical protein
MSAALKFWLAFVVYVALAVWFLFYAGVHLTPGQVLLFWAVVYAAQWLTAARRDN